MHSLLTHSNLSKADLVQLGAVRFGISTARLHRMNLAEIVDAIESALRNEESLDVISRQAAMNPRRFR